MHLSLPTLKRYAFAFLHQKIHPLEIQEILLLPLVVLELQFLLRLVALSFEKQFGSLPILNEPFGAMLRANFSYRR